MKTTRVALAGALTLVGAALVAPSAAADETYVPDAALNACINKAADAAGGIANVTTLECQDAGVTSVEGIDRFAAQLTFVNLNKNRINDTAPLAGLEAGDQKTVVEVYDQTVTLPPAYVGDHQTIFSSDIGQLPGLTGSVSPETLVSADEDLKGWTFARPGTATLTVGRHTVVDMHMQYSYSGTVTQSAVYRAPQITDQPSGEPASALGATTTIAAKAITHNPVYTATWQYNDGGTWREVPDDPSVFSPSVNGSTFGLDVTAANWAMDNTQVRLVIDTAEGTATSDPASFRIAAAPELVSGLDDVTVNAGSAFTLAAVFNSTAGVAPSAVWEVSEDGGQTWGPLAGVGNDTAADTPAAKAAGGRYGAQITIPDANLRMDGAMFRVTVTNEYGSTTSRVATLAVTPPAATADSSSAPVAVTATTVSKRLAATGGSSLPLLWIGAGLVLLGGVTTATVVMMRRRSA